MTQSAPDHVATYLKQNDPDRYLSTLVLPAKVRPHVQALFAFNADVAAIPTRVSDPAAGEIRLQWWRDALSGEGHGDVARNPLAAALRQALVAYGLPSVPLVKLIDARTFDLYADPMPDLPAFEGYAGATVSVPYQLAAMILNGGVTVEPGDAAGHLGVAHGLIGHLMAFGYNASRGRIMLPLSVLEASGVRSDEVLSGTTSEGLLAALEQVCELADTHLGKADAAIAALPRSVRPAFALSAVLRRELKLLRAAAETPFAQPPTLAAWRKIAALTFWMWRNA